MGAEPPRPPAAIPEVSRLGSTGASLLLFAVSFGVALWSVGGVAMDGLLGWDAYPMIAAHGSALDAFGTELMDGRYPDGRFYRPVASLSVALDRAIPTAYPTLAAPYRLTDVLVCAFGAACVGMLALRMTLHGGRSFNAALVAGAASALALVLHRAQLDVVPFLPRRADGMSAAFMTWTALLVYRRAHPAFVGLAALAAVLSKETGAIAIGLPFAAAWARPPREGDAPLAEALRAAVAPMVAVALAVGARFLVLGELGGHAETGFAFGRALATTKATLLASAEGAPGGALAIGALAIAAALGAAALGAGRALVLPLSWLAAALAITAFSGRAHPWYAIQIAPPLALLVGIAMGAGSSPRARWTLLSTAAGTLLLVLIALGGRAPERRALLDHASAVSADQDGRFRALLEGLSRGQAATFSPYFIGANDASGAQELVHAPYSLSALAELAGYEVEVGAASLTSRRTVEDPFATIQLSAPMSRGM